MSGLGGLCRSYLDVRWTFDPAQGTRAGNEASDPMLPMLDAESVRLQLATLRSLAGAVEDLPLDDDAEELDRTGLLDDLRTTIFRFESEVPHRHNPAAWLSSVAQAWQSLLAHPGRVPEARAQAALARLQGAPAVLSAAALTLKAPAVLFVDEAVALAPSVALLPARLARVAAGWLPEISDQLGAAAALAEGAVRAFAGQLTSGTAPSADPAALAVGEDEFDHRLHFEHALHASAPELWRWGQRSLEEQAAQVAQAAERVERGADPRALAARLRRERPAARDAQLVFLRAVARARKFVDDRGLLVAPAGDVRLLDTPEFLRPIVPVAGYEAPTVVYLTPGPAVAREELVHVALREVCPGRHLHRAHSAGLRSDVRRLVATPVSVDGWALYATDLMFRAGFAESAEEEFFHQFALLHAAALVVVDVGIHTRGMTPAEAIAFLMDHLPLDQSAALADVRRVAAWPTYGLAAAAGRREILQLHDAWRARAGVDAPIKAFHQALLDYGGLPVSLARWGMDLGLDE
ncbi:MAG TPA: DUF885 family protein [Gemmatimonadales bacterium]|nr:DUF885 family protein [Gemmatimonadales bacterium]